MLNGDLRLRVYNRAKYDVGVAYINGATANIKPGSFSIMSVNDILYIETAFKGHFFTKGLLVPVDESGKEVTMAEFGFEDAEDRHQSDRDIGEMLKQSNKKIEAWLDTIEDQAELHAIYEVAKDMDLPASKLKILSSKIKNKDWLGEYGEEA